MFIKPTQVALNVPTQDTSGNTIDPATLTMKLYIDGVAAVGAVYQALPPTQGKFVNLETALPDVDGTYALTVTATNPAGVESAPSVPANAVVVDTALIPPEAPNGLTVS